MNETMQSSHADVPAITQSPQSMVSDSPVAMTPACSRPETVRRTPSALRYAEAERDLASAYGGS